jgi:hypothetical protein
MSIDMLLADMSADMSAIYQQEMKVDVMVERNNQPKEVGATECNDKMQCKQCHAMKSRNTLGCNNKMRRNYVTHRDGNKTHSNRE